MVTQTKHEHLADTLRRRIEHGDYVDELPSEADLVDEFGYSRSTVRQAFVALENEGIISARSGSRRRVKLRDRWDWMMTEWERSHTVDADAWAVSIREQGGDPSTSVTIHIERAAPDVAEALGVEVSAQVLVRRRVRSVNGDPHQLVDSYFPYWIVEKHPEFLDPGDISAPGGLLAAAGLRQERCVDAITARMPTPDEARMLAATRGVPLLIHTRTGYARKGKPVRHMVTRMAADQVHVRYELDL